jgi:ATP-binding cassette subfamily B (MDR/TAP) protein 1
MLMFSLFLTSTLSKRYINRKVAANATASAFADEVISSIRNAIAFNTQEKFANQYDESLAIAEKSDFQVAICFSVLLAACMTIVQLTYVRCPAVSKIFTGCRSDREIDRDLHSGKVLDSL